MTTPVAPTPAHKQSFIEAAIAFVTSASFITELSTVGHSSVLPAYITGAVLTVATFLRKEAPYIRDLLKAWNARRKSANAVKDPAYQTLQTDSQDSVGTLTAENAALKAQLATATPTPAPTPAA